jgi:hypothetical protein
LEKASISTTDLKDLEESKISSDFIGGTQDGGFLTLSFTFI